MKKRIRNAFFYFKPNYLRNIIILKNAFTLNVNDFFKFKDKKTLTTKRKK